MTVEFASLRAFGDEPFDLEQPGAYLAFAQTFQAAIQFLAPRAHGIVAARSSRSYSAQISSDKRRSQPMRSVCNDSSPAASKNGAPRSGVSLPRNTKGSTCRRSTRPVLGLPWAPAPGKNPAVLHDRRGRGRGRPRRSGGWFPPVAGRWEPGKHVGINHAMPRPTLPAAGRKLNRKLQGRFLDTAANGWRGWAAGTFAG